MDLKVREDSFQNADHSWLGSAHGVEAAETIELDLSTFTKADHFPNGYLPSGLALGKITVGGVFGIYDNAAADGRTVMVGHLLHDVKVAADNETGRAIGALFTHGVVVEANLPANHGVDANGKTDVAGRIRYR